VWSQNIPVRTPFKNNATKSRSILNGSQLKILRRTDFPFRVLHFHSKGSTRLNGKQPRVANMLVEDHLRPAAVKARILSSDRDDEGRLVDDDPQRLGFHNLRHSLASFLVRIRTDPKTAQTLLRHSDVKLTLQCYTHSASENRMAAAGVMLTAIFSHAADRSGLKAD
jgi:integrase